MTLSLERCDIPYIFTQPRIKSYVSWRRPNMSKEPTSHKEWKRRITVDCCMTLTPKSEEEQVAALRDGRRNSKSCRVLSSSRVIIF